MLSKAGYPVGGIPSKQILKFLCSDRDLQESMEGVKAHWSLPFLGQSHTYVHMLFLAILMLQDH